jgi:formylglycine-generating enzyme required for sulfatase activity
MYTPTWIAIPAGQFQMGSDPGGDVVPYENENPRHRVHVDAFQLARTHITNAQYAEFVSASGHLAPGHWLDGQIPEDLADHPVTYVDWYDALAFCQWAGVRLLTEAEWEKAARSEDARLWPWGNQPPDAHRCNYGKHIFTTSPVHQFPQGASPYGALDLAGNAWEWTSSLAREYPYAANDGREDPTGGEARIVRGGSYTHDARGIRAADRHSFVPGTQCVYLGFRVARTSAAEPTPLALEWVDIPAGEFQMGNDPRSFHDLALPNECPAHSIPLAEFSIAQTPVTNAEYETFVRATHHLVPAHWIGDNIPPEKENHPVTNVSWDSAQDFCQWASVRLLTEAEWEKAARGARLGNARVYPWGDEIPQAPCANYGQDVKTHSTTPVDQYPVGASPYGVFDMAGNVWEWTSSVLTDYPYRMDDGREDVTSRAHRVLRGGSFYSPSESYIRCASRSSSYPQRRRDHIGFRVAKK